jgi:hypothetical protein
MTRFSRSSRKLYNYYNNKIICGLKFVDLSVFSYYISAVLFATTKMYLQKWNEHNLLFSLLRR